MNYADRVQDSFTTTGTGVITLAGAAPLNFQVLPVTWAVGAAFPYSLVHRTLNEWEDGVGTVTATNTFSRAPTASSNSGSLVNFSAGTKDFSVALTSVQIAKFAAVDSLAFATTVSLTQRGTCYMPQQSVASVLGFTLATNPVQGALVYVRLVADGTNTPTFTGFKEWGGSLGYDNRNGIVNEVQFFHDGYDAWYSISQAVGATAVDATAPTASSAAVANATPTFVDITMSEAMDTAYTPAASAVTVSGHTVSALAWLSTTVLRATVSAAFVNAEAARTAAYTQPGTNNARDLAGNLLANFTGLAITNNVAAPANAVTMSGPSSGVVSSASTNFTVGVSPVGGVISGTVVVTPSDGGASGTFTPTTVSLTTAAPSGTFTYTPASTGAKTISATNNGGLTNPANLTYTATSAATVPGAPTIGTATAGDGYVDVAFTAPASDGGAAITSYTATLSTGETATGTVSPIRVTAANGTARTGHITATNSVGTGSASAESNSVTPTAASAAQARLTNRSLLTESGTGPWTYTSANGQSFDGSAGGLLADSAASLVLLGTSSTVQFTISSFSSGNDTLVGFIPAAASALANFNTMPYAVYANSPSYQLFATGASVTPNGTAITTAVNDVVKIVRSGTTIVVSVSKDSGSTWTVLHTWSGVPTSSYRFEAIARGNGVGAGAVTNILTTGAVVG